MFIFETSFNGQDIAVLVSCIFANKYAVS